MSRWGRTCRPGCRNRRLSVARSRRASSRPQCAPPFRVWGRDWWGAPGFNGACGRRFSQRFGKLPHGYDHKFVYSHIGYNLKVTDMQAAIGVAQLRKLKGFIEARKRDHAAIGAGLRKHEKHLILHAAPSKADPSWFGYVITVRDEAPFTRAGRLSTLGG